MVTVAMEFLDPCDMITKIKYYVDTDPFQNHDFEAPIPNPFTREVAEENEEYSTRTLEEGGLWKL